MALMKGNTNQNGSCKKGGYGVGIGCEEKYVSRNVINSFTYKCFLILQVNQELMLCNMFCISLSKVRFAHLLEQFFCSIFEKNWAIQWNLVLECLVHQKVFHKGIIKQLSNMLGTLKKLNFAISYHLLLFVAMEFHSNFVTIINPS